jgi:hypothetical protein
MKLFVGGVAAVLLGLLGIIIWNHAVCRFIGGAVPLILLLGGLMMAYLGYDEAKEKLPLCCKAKETQEPTSDVGLKEEAERYKQEVEKLKSELEKAKTSEKGSEIK